MIVDPHRVVLTGENPFIRLSVSEGGAGFEQCKLIAHPVFTRRAGQCPLPEERTHRQPLAHLFG